jgi:hypothetical protein
VQIHRLEVVERVDVAKALLDKLRNIAKIGLTGKGKNAED